MWILGIVLGGISVVFMVGMWLVDRWINANNKDINNSTEDKEN
jgi:hypothetical protein